MALQEGSSTGSLPSNPEAQGGNANITTTAVNNTSVPPSAMGDDAKYTVMLVLTGSVFALILFLVLLFGCVAVIRSKYQTSSTKSRQRNDSEASEIYQDTKAKPSKKSGQRKDSEESAVYQNTNGKPSKGSRQRKDSEESGVYHNTHTNSNVWNADSMKTYLYRQLPQLPVEAKPSVDAPDGEENDDYLVPISPLRYGHENEISNLPPAPPVFPKCLANLLLGGEGSYMSVISDDEAQLLPQSLQCEISLDRNSSEIYEENGYLQPRQIRNISVETSSSETESPNKLKKIKDNKHQKSMRVSPDITTQTAPKKSQDISECKSYDAKDESTTNIAEIKSEEAKRFRSTLQIHLSPPTRPRPVSVSTKKATVLVCIHTDY
jgi:hypothetical protein